MTRHWYLIENDSRRRIDVSEDRWDFWSEFHRNGGHHAPWPGFSQIAVNATIDALSGALLRFARDIGARSVDLSEAPERWDQGICLARHDGLSLASEPGRSLDERLLGSSAAEQIFRILQTDGVYFGYKPPAGTLHLARYQRGELRFSWADSLEPGPSYALTLHPDGKATHEDPRTFALRALGQPDTSPFLDRYDFFESTLASAGLSAVHPDLEGLPIEAAIEVLIPHESLHGG